MTRTLPAEADAPDMDAPPPILDRGGVPTYALTNPHNPNPTPDEFLATHFALLSEAHASGLLDSPAGRREFTRYDPFMFALLYMPHYLILDPSSPLNTDPTTPLGRYGGITLNQFHVDAYLNIEEWAFPPTATRQDRDAWVAPRESAKSTLFFTIGPIWAAAHQHVNFIAAFSDSDDQVQKHLAKFHENIDNNPALKKDFPDLCAPARRDNGNAVSDNKNEYVAKSGFTFTAHTVDGKIVGLVNFRNERPDLIILDDIEPSEDKYSAALKAKGLRRLQDKILYLNERARVILVGTVTMAGSIMHDIVQSVLNPGSIPPNSTPRNPHRRGGLTAEWIIAQNFRGHYYPALSIDPTTGQLTSLWPEKWPVQELAPRLGTNDFMKNMQNNPVGDGDYWEKDDIRYGRLDPDTCTVTLLSLDPAVTVSSTSDYTGLAVIRYQPATRDPQEIIHLQSTLHPDAPPLQTAPNLTREQLAFQWAHRRGRRLPPNPTPEQRAAFIADILPLIPMHLSSGLSLSPENTETHAPIGTAGRDSYPLLPTHQSRCEITWANRVKMKPHRLKLYVLSILEQYPEITILLIETNQGHDFVSDPFQELPVRVITLTQSEPKDTRIARFAQYYKSPIPRVLHADHFIPLEEEMLAYPQTAHDDTTDAAASGVNYFLHKPPSKKPPRPRPTVTQNSYVVPRTQHRQTQSRSLS